MEFLLFIRNEKYNYTSHKHYYCYSNCLTVSLYSRNTGKKCALPSKREKLALPANQQRAFFKISKSPSFSSIFQLREKFSEETNESDNWKLAAVAFSSSEKYFSFDEFG